MKQLVFATSNANKIREVNDLLADHPLEVVSMQSIGCVEDIPETQPTIEGNALQKARYLYTHYQQNCFAEDTGLEIDCLNGEPGVYSARYAGAARDANANMDLVLSKMQHCDDRTARFRTVVALIIDGQEYTFEGIVEGAISHGKTGSEGFGYDPIFVPQGYTTSFAEMSGQEKNKISHRGRAIAGFIDFLNRQEV